jgi:uncharacterized protein
MKTYLSLLKFILFYLLILGSTWSAEAEITFPAKPSSGNFVVDSAEMIKEADRTEINRIALALLQEKNMPVLVVTLPSRQAYGALGVDIETYARMLFDEWGIGFPEWNYGMLLLVSQSDRKARIELGADWGRSHDHKARQVMDKLIIPSFKGGQFSQGILYGVKGLNAMARNLDSGQANIPWRTYALPFAGLVLALGIIISLFKSGRHGWGWALIAGLGMLLLFFLRPRRRRYGVGSRHRGGRTWRGGGGSRGGGGPFGGGSSGGGGATGSW